MAAAVSEITRGDHEAPQDTRRTWAYFGAVVVGVLAAVLRLLGVDNVELVATLLFAVVFGTALLRGQVAGFIAAGLATAVYAWLRRDALDDVGAARFAVVIAGRALSYVALAKVSQLVSDRLPSVPLPGLRDRPMPEGVTAPAAEAAFGASPGAAFAPEPTAERWEESQGERDGLDDLMPARWGALEDDEPAWGPPAQSQLVAEPEGWAVAEPETGQPATPFAQPPPPAMPKGWMDDDPLGQETIPVGFTGELFLREPEQPAIHAAEPEDRWADPDTGLQTSFFLRDRLSAARDASRAMGSTFSVVMVQIPDTPFQGLPQRRQATLLRELGHQFTQAGMVDHLVHLPDGVRHWFAVVLAETDKSGAHAFERRLRSAIAGYLRNRGLRMEEVESASLTSPDDDETMRAIWESLLGQPAGTG